MSIHPSEEQVARAILEAINAKQETDIAAMRAAIPDIHVKPVDYQVEAWTAARAVMALFGTQPTVAQVKAEALREAADAEECGCPGDWNGTVCDTCQGFARRLRARAARIEKEQA